MTKKLKTNNMKLKGLVTQVTHLASDRECCCIHTCFPLVIHYARRGSFTSYLRGQLIAGHITERRVAMQMRSTRNFCLDVILISVLLAIGLFIFNMFHPL